MVYGNWHFIILRQLSLLKKSRKGQYYIHHIQDVIAEGDKVVVKTIYTGTHEGDFFGAPPTGNTFKYLGIHILTVKDGMIVEAWVLEDMLYLWQQLGMELKPEEDK